MFSFTSRSVHPYNVSVGNNKQTAQPAQTAPSKAPLPPKAPSKLAMRLHSYISTTLDPHAAGVRHLVGGRGRTPELFPDLNFYALSKQAGCSESNLNNILRGRRNGSIDMLMKIATVLGISLEQLLDIQRIVRAYHDGDYASVEAALDDLGVPVPDDAADIPNPNPNPTPRKRSRNHSSRSEGQSKGRSKGRSSKRSQARRTSRSRKTDNSIAA